MLADGEANAQDNGKMQQEVFGLATILLSKLEKHSTPKQGKVTHMDSGAAASQMLNCEQGSENRPRGRGRPRSDGTGTEGPMGAQAGERILRGTSRKTVCPSRAEQGLRQAATRQSCRKHLLIQHLLCAPSGYGETKSGCL